MPYMKKKQTRDTLSQGTMKLYSSWMRRFVVFSENRHPEDMGVAEINAFLQHLAIDGQVSPITQQQARGALVWVYLQVLCRDIEAEGKIIRVKRPQRLTVTHHHESIMAVLSNLSGIYRLIGFLMYGSGLAPLECLKLRVEDVDIEHKKLSVRGRSGMVVRETVLPDSLLAELKRHITDLGRRYKQEISDGLALVRTPNEKKVVNSWGLQWVFPATRRYQDRETGQYIRHHLHETAFQKNFRKALKLADLPQAISPRHLRTSFAARLITQGYTIRTVQEAIGHKSVKTTMTLSRSCGHHLRGVVSPIDQQA